MREYAEFIKFDVSDCHCNMNCNQTVYHFHDILVHIYLQAILKELE